MSTPAPGTPITEIDTSLHVFYFGAALVSVVSSLYVVFSYWKYHDKCSHPSRLLFWRSIFDTAFAISIIWLYALPDDIRILDSCNAIGSLFHFALLGSQSWYFMITIDLLISLRNPFSYLGSKIKYYHLFVVSFSTLAVAILLGTDSFGFRRAFQVCWIRRTDSSMPSTYSFALLFIPTLVYYLVGVAVTIYAFSEIRKGLRETLQFRKKALTNSLILCFAYCSYWTVAGILFVILFSEDSDDDKPHLFGAFAVIIGALGLVDGIVWIIFQGFPWRSTPSRLRLPSKMSDYEDMETELVKPINYQLRKEILLFTSRGICDVVDEANYIPHFESPPTETFYPQNEHTRAVMHPNAVFEETIEDPDSGTVEFYGYAYQVFRYIRQILGMSERSFHRSFAAVERSSLAASGANQERKQFMKEKFSEGKSQSFFYFTSDLKYMVKTLRQSEVSFLLKILPKYVDHLSANPNTMMCKLIGLHAIRMYHQTVYFVVMESVFLTNLPIHERFDIKGSWINRKHQTLPDRDKRGFIKGAMKDEDVHKPFLVGRSRKRQILKQAQKDSAFLRSLNIMDYSMLVGVRYVRQYHPVGPSAVNTWIDTAWTEDPDMRPHFTGSASTLQHQPHRQPAPYADNAHGSHTDRTGTSREVEKATKPNLSSPTAGGKRSFRKNSRLIDPPVRDGSNSTLLSFPNPIHAQSRRNTSIASESPNSPLLDNHKISVTASPPPSNPNSRKSSLAHAPRESSNSAVDTVTARKGYHSRTHSNSLPNLMVPSMGERERDSKSKAAKLKSHGSDSNLPQMKNSLPADTALLAEDQLSRSEHEKSDSLSTLPPSNPRQSIGVVQKVAREANGLSVADIEHHEATNGRDRHTLSESLGSSNLLLLDDDQYVPDLGGRPSLPDTPRLPRRPVRRSEYLFHQHEGGVRAEVVEGPGIYYFGIVDILQEYNIWKKLEHYFKVWVLRRDPRGISCTHPDFYQLRFMNKLRAVLEGVDHSEMMAVTATRSGSYHDEWAMPSNPPRRHNPSAPSLVYNYESVTPNSSSIFTGGGVSSSAHQSSAGVGSTRGNSGAGGGGVVTAANENSHSGGGRGCGVTFSRENINSGGGSGGVGGASISHARVHSDGGGGAHLVSRSESAANGHINAPFNGHSYANGVRGDFQDGLRGDFQHDHGSRGTGVHGVANDRRNLEHHEVKHDIVTGQSENLSANHKDNHHLSALEAAGQRRRSFSDNSDVPPSRLISSPRTSNASRGSRGSTGSKGRTSSSDFEVPLRMYAMRTSRSKARSPDEGSDGALRGNMRHRTPPPPASSPRASAAQSPTPDGGGQQQRTGGVKKRHKAKQVSFSA